MLKTRSRGRAATALMNFERKGIAACIAAAADRSMIQLDAIRTEIPGLKPILKEVGESL